MHAVAEWLYGSAYCCQEESDGHCQHARGARCSDQCRVKGRLRVCLCCFVTFTCYTLHTARGAQATAHGSHLIRTDFFAQLAISPKSEKIPSIPLRQISRSTSKDLALPDNQQHPTFFRSSTCPCPNSVWLPRLCTAAAAADRMAVLYVNLSLTLMNCIKMT